MLNCRDHKSITFLFEMICIVFISPFETKEFWKALEHLKKCIEEVDIKVDDFLNARKTTLQKNKKRADVDNSDNEDSLNEDDEEDNEINTETIKEASPFTKDFQEIQVKVVNKQPLKGVNNGLHRPSFINFLQKNFMPYAFIWSGFAFGSIDDELPYTCHITNGTVENKFKLK